MPETVDEWVRKADGDFKVTVREFAANDDASHDAVCFHAQQCIEKLMKAVLVAQGIDPPKTHNLLFLDDLLRSTCPTWQAARDDIEFLTRSGVTFRYPGEWATRTHAIRAKAICERLRSELLTILGEARG